MFNFFSSNESRYIEIYNKAFYIKYLFKSNKGSILEQINKQH